MAIYRLGDDSPRIADDAWVAESAHVIGRVELAAGCSVWDGAVLRGDNEWIVLGERSNIQEGAVLHTDMGHPLAIGADVTVGHQAMLHGCTVEDGALIGIQAVVLNGARIGAGSLVGACALVTEGAQFPPGSLILGSPAKAVRSLSPEQAARLRFSALHYVDNAQRHRSTRVRIG
ncbi:MAG: gamma carbonic anhydrase family protein [Rubrivivax sp.]|nr:gamma carbonic anhydrase family protein [Rubrivivax sp.]